MGDLTAKTKVGFGASRANYMSELICERLTGQAADKFTNDAMRWGTEQEPAARLMYEMMTGQDVVQVGAIAHPTIADTLASPDGLVGTDGMIEIKAPSTSVHIETLLSGVIDGRHIKQTQWQMACSGRSHVDFVSFDPRMPASMQLWIKRIERDDKLISELEEQVQEFLHELDAKVKALREKYEAKELAA